MNMEELKKVRNRLHTQIKRNEESRIELDKREISLNEDMMMCNFHLIELMEDSLK